MSRSSAARDSLYGASPARRAPRSSARSCPACDRLSPVAPNSRAMRPLDRTRAPPRRSSCLHPNQPDGPYAKVLTELPPHSSPAVLDRMRPSCPPFGRCPRNRIKLNPDIQEYGRTPGLRTNKRLESLLDRVFGLALADVYATNAFPFIKPGGMSTAIPVGDVVRAVQLFVAAELTMVQPTMVLAVGVLAHTGASASRVLMSRIPPRELATQKHMSWRGAKLLRDMTRHG